MKIDTVAGLEMNAVPHLKYIRCDGCGAVFDSTPKTKDGAEVRRQALAAGWNHEAPDIDHCPACAP